MEGQAVGRKQETWGRNLSLRPTLAPSNPLRPAHSSPKLFWVRQEGQSLEQVVMKLKAIITCDHFEFLI